MPDQDKPSPISLNLDSLDREGGTAEPFAVVHGGRRYVMLDPQEIDWRDLMRALNQPSVFFTICMSADDAASFAATKLPGWKLHSLITAYIQHYGLTSSPEAPALPTL